MRSTFIAAINQICAEKNVKPDDVLEAVKLAIATAYRKDYGNKEQEIRVVLREDQDMPSILLVKEVVDDVENENFEISLKDAKKVRSDIDVGEEIEIDVTPVEYGRIAAQAAKQVILQKLQESEKQSLYEMFKDRERQLLTATVTKVETNWVTLDIEGMTVSLPWREQIPGEHYYTGKRIRVYLDTVEFTGKGPQLRISRTHSELVRKLLELEIPEIRNGDVAIMAIARDAGFRSKVAVKSNDPRIDPIGACVGQKGVRIQAVMEEINGERVDMIEWSDDPIKLIFLVLLLKIKCYKWDIKLRSNTHCI
jgi:N utilization substance protein A